MRKLLKSQQNQRKHHLRKLKLKLLSNLNYLETLEITTESEETPSEKTEVEIVVKPEVEEEKPSEVPTEESTVTYEETLEITTESEETPSEKTEVEIVVKPEVEEEKPSEVPTDESTVTYEKTLEITTEEKETPSEKTEAEIVVKPEVEEEKPTEVPTEETPVTFEESMTIVKEETEKPVVEITEQTTEQTIAETVSVEEIESKPEKVETTISINVEESLKAEANIDISVAEMKAPEIIKHLTSIKIPEGKELVLTVEYISQPESVVTWFVDEQPLVEQAEYKITIEKTFSTLVISEISPEDEGEYKVVVENDIGQTTTTCFVQVIPFEVEEKPKETTVEMTTKLTEETTEEVKEVTAMEIEVTEKPKEVVSMEIEVKEEKPSDLTTVEIEVKDQPKSTVSMEIEVEEQPSETSITEVEVKEKPTEKVTTEIHVTKDEESTLTFEVEKPSKPDTKEREIPEIAPAPKEVEEGVPEAPRFIETLQQHIDVIEGTPVTLQCVTVGQPTVTWYQDDEPLEESDHFVVEFDSGVCRLTISDIFLEDEAEYKCTAVNEFGSASTIVELFVEKCRNAAEILLHEEIVTIEVELELYYRKEDFKLL
ncbi:TTN [Mytilus edulis]|uniref:TTN n=1 Tax=Mytilus edulis TaxID=6550 RepID=A0A8S3PVG9_MYTED|nr:TTN [Mytilus edulis]